MLESGRALALRHHSTVQRLGRFALSGFAVQAVYAAVMAICLIGIGFGRQGALAVAYSAALIVHFTLNRQFVFTRDDGYDHGVAAHGTRYLVTAAIVYVITATGLALLPEALGIAPYVAWLLITGSIAILNFVALGRLVFR